MPKVNAKKKMPVKKKQSKKKSANRSSSGPKGPSGAGSVMMLAHATCAVTNPFCPEANGSKWPDGSFARSVTWDIDGAPFDIATGAGGIGNAIFLPGFKYHTNTFASYTGDIFTNATTNLAIANPPSNAARFRITSWGIRLTCNLSAMTAAGVVRVRLFSPLTGNSLLNTSMTSQLADECEDVPISRLIGKDVYILPKPTGTDARLFRDATTETATMASWVNPGWQVAQVTVSGAPVSVAGAISAYVFYHYEIVFQDGDSSNAFARPPPSANPVVREASEGVLSRVGNFFEGAAEKVDNIFKSKAVKLLASGIAARYGGPQAAGSVYAIADAHQNARHVD